MSQAVWKLLMLFTTLSELDILVKSGANKNEELDKKKVNEKISELGNSVKLMKGVIKNYQK